MLASKRAEPEAPLPPPKQRLFAQLNVRIDPTLDARFKRYCQLTQIKQAQVVNEALDAYLKSKGR